MCIRDSENMFKAKPRRNRERRERKRFMRQTNVCTNEECNDAKCNNPSTHLETRGLEIESFRIPEEAKSNRFASPAEEPKKQPFYSHPLAPSYPEDQSADLHPHRHRLVGLDPKDRGRRRGRRAPRRRRRVRRRRPGRRRRSRRRRPGRRWWWRRAADVHHAGIEVLLSFNVEVP